MDVFIKAFRDKNKWIQVCQNVQLYRGDEWVSGPESGGGNKSAPVLLICRSGKRTLDAGLALEAAGYTDVYNVLHGFEGELDDRFHRSTVNGWRFDGLPWEQL